MNKIVEKVSQQSGLSRFVSLEYTSKGTGETARYTVQLGFSYRNAVEESLLRLEIDKVEMLGIRLQAAEELIQSFRKTLSGTQDGYTKENTYSDYLDESGIPVMGVKINKNDNSVKIFGLVKSKVELAPPTKVSKPKVSAPLTVEKESLRRELPVGKFREFDLGQINQIKINKETISIN